MEADLVDLVLDFEVGGLDVVHRDDRHSQQLETGGAGSDGVPKRVEHSSLQRRQCAVFVREVS